MSSSNIIIGINDLKTWCVNHNAMFILEELDIEKNGELTSENIAYASNKKMWWLCPKNHSYSAKVSNRTLLGRGCPYCSGSKTLEGFNDFKTWCIENHREDLLNEWDYAKNAYNPSQISAHNNKKVWWKCNWVTNGIVP